MLKTIASAALLVSIHANGANAQSIERVQSPDPASLILHGVKIPANAELYMLSGLVALPADPTKAESFENFGDTRTQTINTLNRIRERLRAQGYEMRDVVKLTVFLVGDPKLGGKLDYDGMNAGFSEFFRTADNPNTVARSTVQVAALASPYYLVEIDAIAARVLNK